MGIAGVTAAPSASQRGYHHYLPPQPGQPAAGVARVQGGGEGVRGPAKAPKLNGIKHFHASLWYDEPEILRYSNRQFGLIGADAG